jgi:1,6-anhydro-N-acetylmuramate kinase
MTVSAHSQQASNASAKARFVVGTMTGTSIDGELDAALVAIHGTGLNMRGDIVASRSWPLGAIAEDLRRVASQTAMTAKEFTRINRAFGELHADALEAVCSDAGVQPDLAVLHGQTVFHAPPLSWQLIDPWPTATRLHCRVRYDLRSANIASGGQGAPITPLADFMLFASPDEPCIVVNLGGFVNATLLPRRCDSIDLIRGYDICACNHVLDHLARTRLHAAFDRDGMAASAGQCDEGICARIESAIQPSPTSHARPRSLGTGDEAIRIIEMTSHLRAEDACRSAVEAIARCIARTLCSETNASAPTPHSIPLLIAGGSARNRALHAALASHWNGPVRTTNESHGIPVGMREAAAMAILGACADDGVRYTLPSVTGARSVVMESALIENGNTNFPDFCAV